MTSLPVHPRDESEGAGCPSGVGTASAEGGGSGGLGLVLLVEQRDGSVCPHPSLPPGAHVSVM